ncbi:diguanylate cyclase (GGDEF) domain-containing protein [Marinobacter daqiaonensis]|uniref:diguanylate cyclase n=1 Tax=Marinobacter daqiaonensis TaxID=650891 RepID=A0A1I6J441_9GAMM|nr:GGDEF domain-containing protein [Marinobacter daqiaonensis]SFR73785.1 diguanylate cyclase (GGDEF) domain-containing protein [Marinobacter daqiaonensis]
MTETRLRTLTSFTAYGLCAVFFIALAVQNLRFGFYELFYLSSGLGAVAAFGGAYTLTVRHYQLRARGHLPALALMGLLLVTTAWLQTIETAIFWCLPVLTLAFLVLPLKAALQVSVPLVFLLALQIVTTLPPASALPVVVAMILLMTCAGLSSRHYSHVAQSAEDLAITDPVTGAHNARYLDETLQKEISRARVTGHPVSILMLGIDHHDEVKDLLGSNQIQELYRGLAEHLFSLIRAGDTLYFLGEGRFCLILPFTPEEGARVTSERIRRSIASENWPRVARITVSIGATAQISQETQAERLRQRATDALDEAARRGHDSVWFYTDSRRVA